MNKNDGIKPGVKASGRKDDHQMKGFQNVCDETYGWCHFYELPIK